MTKRSKRVRAFLAAALAGSMLLQVGSCTSQDVKAQFSKGLTTALNGVFNIATTDFANEVFDVDD